MLRYDRQTKPGLVALYDIRPGNGAGPFLQPRSPQSIYRSLDVTGVVPVSSSTAVPRPSRGSDKVCMAMADSISPGVVTNGAGCGTRAAGAVTDSLAGDLYSDSISDF